MTEPGSEVLEYLEVEILKAFPLHANHGAAFVGLMCGLVCTKNSEYVNVL